MAEYETLTVTVEDGGVMIVTLNRPDRLNAMNTAMMLELRDLFQQLYVYPDRARVVVITGAGEKGFCPGADLKERDGMSDATWRSQHAIVEQIARGMFQAPMPLIAAVNGVAMGGGAEIALCCDFIYAADHARFAFPEVTRSCPAWPARRTCRARPACAGPRKSC